MFADEDCVDSRSDVDDLRTRDCLYDDIVFFFLCICCAHARALFPEINS